MDQDYLQPGFNPNSLTVPQLRRILLEHHLKAPYKARKPQLVQVFENEIVPQLDKLRAQLLDVKPTSKGIEKVTKKKLKHLRQKDQDKKKEQITSILIDNEMEKNDNKGDKKNNSDEIDDESKQIENIQFKLEGTDDKYTELKNGKAKKYKSKNDSIHKSKVKIESEEIENESVSDENDLINKKRERDAEPVKQEKVNSKKQKKAKKLKEPKIKTPKKEPTRRDTPKKETPKREQSLIKQISTPQKEISMAKQTLTLQDSSIDNSMSSTRSGKKNSKKNDLEKLNLLPINPIHASKSPKDKKTAIDAQLSSEAIDNEKDISPFFKPKNMLVFTDDDEIESDVENKSESRDENKSNDITPKSNKKIKLHWPKFIIQVIENFQKKCKGNSLNKRKLIDVIKPTLFNLTIFLFIAIPILFFIWYHEQRLVIGYCNQKMNFKRLFDEHSTWSKIDNFLSFFKPNCLKCPINANCFERMAINCKKGFVERKSILSFGGILPISNYCVPNRIKERVTRRMVKKLSFFLNFKNGKVDCGKSADIVKSGINISDLKNIFQNDIAKFNFTKPEKTKLWEDIVHGLLDDNDINLYKHMNGTMTYLRSTSTSKCSFGCKYGFPILQVLNDFKSVLVLLLGLVVFAINLKKQIKKMLSSKLQISDYTAKAYAELRKTKDNVEGPKFLHTLQLRDVILCDITDINEKNRIWTKMVKNLEKDNENVISSQMEINGEILKCWMLKDSEHGMDH